MTKPATIRCPKCRYTSGDDWRQCEGACPMPMSPHYNKNLADALERGAKKKDRAMSVTNDLKNEILTYLLGQQRGGAFTTPKTSTQIAKHLKAKPRDVQKAMTELANVEKVRYSHADGWQLTTKGLFLEEARVSTLLAVGWIPASNPGPQLFRGRVTADLGVVDPPFSDAEMQQITHAAKMEAARVVARRKKAA